MRYAVIENNIVTNIIEATGALPGLEMVMDDGSAIIGGSWDGQQFIAPKPVPPTIDDYTQAVQQHLDDKAKERHYDGILSACTYATSTVASFAAEGQACVNWRDEVWNACYALLSNVEAGLVTPPSIDHLIEQLPVLVWP